MLMAKRVTIVGAGSWGLAISHLLAQTGARITMWEYVAADLERLKSTRANPDKLRAFTLNPRVELTGNLAEAVEKAEVAVLAVPSQYVRGVIRPVAATLASCPILVNLAKGIETGSLCRMSQVLVEETGAPLDRIVTLSGPSHAEEVVLDMPTTVVAASVSHDRALAVQELFSVSNFRVYESDDIAGVELGGSLKNIVAIAAGIADGLAMGDNTKGALITRGLAEIVRLGLALGARAETFAGLSGLGDLVTTCYSRHSRNRFVGEQIGKGRKLPDILAGMTMVAEGVETARSGLELARRHQVEMPITEEIVHVLFDGRPVDEAAANLLGRRLKAEIWS
jgi:glycerol-3-phosphate dehydrogenase (NAD(P)+)